MIEFRDDEQRQRVCAALLRTVGLSRLWTSGCGPTPRARELAGGKATSLKPPQRAVLRVVWALWNDKPVAVTLSEVLGSPATAPLLRLLVASLYGPRAVDVWLSRPQPDSFVTGRRGTRAAAARLFDEARAVLAEAGDLPIDFDAAPDACALGVVQMADFALLVGVDAIDDGDETRHAKALRMAVQALGAFAAMSRQSATKPKKEPRA